MNLRKKTSIFSVILASASWLALADVPVVDLSQQPADVPSGTSVNNAGAPIQNAPSTSNPTDAAQVEDNTDTVNQNYSQPQNAAPTPTIDNSSLPLNDRVARLEQQQQNAVAMNLPQQISDLQQQVAQLRGQLQVQAHDLQLLNQQQRTFYQDLDNRIKQLSNLNSTSSANSAATKVGSADALNANPASIQLKENAAFQAGIDALTKKQYPKAISQFQAYLSDYPNGQYAANATYWLGDIYFTQNNNKQAATQFATLIKTYPASSKVPDAKLKLAIIHANGGSVAQAKKEFQEIIKDHPNSTAAQLANIRLQQLSATG